MKLKIIATIIVAAGLTLFFGATSLSLHGNANPSKPLPASQTEQPLPVIPQVDLPQVDPVPVAQNTVVPVSQLNQEQTAPDASIPATTPQPCTINTPIDTMCITSEGHLGRAVGQSANGIYMAVVSGSDNPNVTMPTGFDYQIETIGE